MADRNGITEFHDRNLRVIEKTVRSRASGIDVPDSLALPRGPFMGMTVNHDIDIGGTGIEFEFIEIVYDKYPPHPGFNGNFFGEIRKPRGNIDIPPDRNGRCYACKFLKNRGLADITGMKDGICAFET
jgi:hypothetical protein